LAVQDPMLSAPARGGGEAARDAGADRGLGQCEGADLLGSLHRGEPTLLLLIRTAQVNRAHGETAVHTMECRDGAIDARKLHHDEAVEQRAFSGAAKA